MCLSQGGEGGNAVAVLHMRYMAALVTRCVQRCCLSDDWLTHFAVHFDQQGWMLLLVLR